VKVEKRGQAFMIRMSSAGMPLACVEQLRHGS
jgi:hypothetical protein